MWKSLLTLWERIGASPEDEADIKVRKRLLVLIALLIEIAGVLWGAIYLLAGEPLAASIPWAYSVGSALSVGVFAITKRFNPFLFGQLALILLTPFLLQLVLGGFVNASAVILWSLVAPMVALIAAGRQQSLWWFGGYALLVVGTELIQQVVQFESSLPGTTRLLFFVMNILGVSGVVFIGLHYFVREKDEALDLLGIERAKSERLLLNVLPKEIATILKNEDQTIADRFPAVSVLFADVVDFTPTSEQLEPEQVVDLLNDVFSYWDALAIRHGCEKIRTVGDNYMVACGVPTTRPDHAQALAHMALEMRDYVQVGEVVSNGGLQFRMGLSTGPAVAGVIGKSKFQYDVWGDTVNTASRMESHGVAGKIQISADAYQVLKDEFVCEPRGTIEVKGKGPMNTWFLESVR